jgi:hypothetical protein
MTREQHTRLVNLADQMGVDVIETRPDFKPSQPEDGVLGAPSGDTVLAIVVNNLGDVAALNAAYNEEYDNHKFWYEIRHTNYVMY